MTSLARRLAGLTGLVLCLLSVAVPVAAQPPAGVPGREGPVRDSITALNYILKYSRLKALSDFQQLDRDPSRTILIVLGDTTELRNVPGRLGNFVAHGGAVLVATDQNSRGNTEELGGCTVSGTLLHIDEDQAYQHVADCPLATAADGNHELFKGGAKGKIKEIATNRPSYLDRWQTSIVAWLDAQCMDESGKRLNQKLPFAAVGSVGGGRYVILADHSIFIDEMMLRDNQNFDFAYNCVDWLRKGGDHRRDRVLFVNNGVVITDFGPALPAPPLPPLPPIPSLNVNKLLTRVEKKLDPLILDLIPRERILRAAVLLVSFALLAYGLLRLWRSRHQVERTAPLFAVSMAQLAPVKNVVEQRHQTVLQEGNLWEAARALTRQLFEGALGARPAEAPADAGLERPRPRIATVASGWQRVGLVNRVGRLWQLAYGSRPRRVSAREFDLLMVEIDRLKAALTEGTLQLHESGRNE